MELAAFTPFLFLTLLLAISTATSNPSCSRPESDPSDATIFHIYGQCSPFYKTRPDSWFNTILNMATKDPARITYLSTLLSNKATSAPVASGQQIFNMGNYLVRVQIGTPPQPMFMVLDTSAYATWLPCSGCTGTCPTTATAFSPITSTTYSPLTCSATQCTHASLLTLTCPTTTNTNPCTFNQTYGGDSTFSAALSTDSLTLGSDVTPNYAFGCIKSISGSHIPPQGVFGLGRGPLSLLAQTDSLYKGVFSYCLPSFKSYYFSGSLKLGPSNQPRKIKTTPLLTNPRRPNLYYVSLTAVSIGHVSIPIPSQYVNLNPATGSGGTIIDAGVVITRFVQPAYEAIRDEFRKQVKGPFSSLGSFDTCFTVSTYDTAAAPTVTFHFAGGLDLALPMENTLIHSSVGSLACLAMAGSPNNLMNVIGNLQQQNLRVLFDLANSRLGVVREVCN